MSSSLKKSFLVAMAVVTGLILVVEFITVATGGRIR